MTSSKFQNNLEIVKVQVNISCWKRVNVCQDEQQLSGCTNRDALQTRSDSRFLHSHFQREILNFGFYSFFLSETSKLIEDLKSSGCLGDVKCGD